VDVYPILTYRDVKAALDWLENAFGLETRVFGHDAGGAGGIDHAALIYGHGMVLAESERPEDLHGSHTGQGWVYIAVADIDTHYQRAKAAGVRVLNEPHDALNSTQRGYSARDLENNLWTFGTARPRP
jgi:uncharacterized glyoxalase superfamily protein PhnB